LISTQGAAVPLRTLTESRDCLNDLGIEFVPNSVTLSDPNRDGHGDVTVAWTVSCRGDVGPVDLKLAVLHDDTYAILKGNGLRHETRAYLAGHGEPDESPSTFHASPAPARWTPGNYTLATNLWASLFT
jgi:hypothetical protein